MHNKIKIISAVDKNWGIGFEGGLPWNFPQELALFKKITSDGNNAIIFGGCTARSIPNMPLVGRSNYVVSKSYSLDDVQTIKESWLDYLQEEMIHNYDNVFICGGSSIYKQALEADVVSSMILTEIKGSYECDRYFPKEFMSDFRLENETDFGDFITREYKKHNGSFNL